MNKKKVPDLVKALLVFIAVVGIMVLLKVVLKVQ